MEPPSETFSSLLYKHYSQAHGIAYVADQLKATPHRELYCVIGFVRDKDLAHILPLLPHDAHYIFTQARSERALPAA